MEKSTSQKSHTPSHVPKVVGDVRRKIRELKVFIETATKSASQDLQFYASFRLIENIYTCNTLHKLFPDDVYHYLLHYSQQGPIGKETEKFLKGGEINLMILRNYLLSNFKITKMANTLFKKIFKNLQEIIDENKIEEPTGALNVDPLHLLKWKNLMKFFASLDQIMFKIGDFEPKRREVWLKAALVGFVENHYIQPLNQSVNDIIKKSREEVQNEPFSDLFKFIEDLIKNRNKVVHERIQESSFKEFKVLIQTPTGHRFYSIVSGRLNLPQQLDEFENSI